jgi:DNA-binding NarL/FixJ family response regulator
MSTTICIIDDHVIVRQGLKQLLEKISDYKVIYEFDNGDDFLESLPLPNIPDLYILDYSMPNKNGIQVLRALEERKEEYKVLLLTQHFDEDIINAAYHHGARGFLHKNCSADELKFAIDNIITVGYTNVTDILKRIKNYTPKEIKIYEAPVLNERELEFLTYICDERELTYEQIAKYMDVSVRTIELQRLALFERYDIKSKVGLVLFSYKYKLTEPFCKF